MQSEIYENFAQNNKLYPGSGTWEKFSILNIIWYSNWKCQEIVNGTFFSENFYDIKNKENTWISFILKGEI